MSASPLDIRVHRDISNRAYTHALFDFDGTISLLREGWQIVMSPVMHEALCGADPPSPEIISEVERFIDATTGIQTIEQMAGLAEMVRAHGGIPLEPREYKRIYNDRLMEHIAGRLHAVACGECPPKKATVRGSLDFVRALHERGVQLFIFSGTDVDDVCKEASLLGVSRYFNEIWGALDSVETYSKERVLRDLIGAHGLSGDQVLVVGDGPVELRNGREHDCAALGVAPDETRGCGWDEHKAKRLLAAGADALVADFAGHEALVRWLFEGE